MKKVYNLGARIHSNQRPRHREISQDLFLYIPNCCTPYSGVSVYCTAFNQKRGRTVDHNTLDVRFDIQRKLSQY